LIKRSNAGAKTNCNLSC